MASTAPAWLQPSPTPSADAPAPEVPGIELSKSQKKKLKKKASASIPHSPRTEEFQPSGVRSLSNPDPALPDFATSLNRVLPTGIAARTPVLSSEADEQADEPGVEAGLSGWASVGSVAPSGKETPSSGGPPLAPVDTKGEPIGDLVRGVVKRLEKVENEQGEVKKLLKDVLDAVKRLETVSAGTSSLVSTHVKANADTLTKINSSMNSVSNTVGSLERQVGDLTKQVKALPGVIESSVRADPSVRGQGSEDPLSDEESDERWEETPLPSVGIETSARRLAKPSVTESAFNLGGPSSIGLQVTAAKSEAKKASDAAIAEYLRSIKPM